MSVTARIHPTDVRAIWSGPIVDADVHVNATLDTLRPYLARQWVDFMDERGVSKTPELPGIQRVYPNGSPSSLMPRWRTEDGRRPASELALVREQLLDPLDVEAAVLNCYMAVDSVRHPDFAAALAAAVNDWLIAAWLERDPRLRASIVLPARSPEAAVAEIERVGDHPGFVQVQMPVRADRPYGNRHWHPLLEAIERKGLVLGLQFGGTPDGSPTPSGAPNYYLADYVGEVGVYWGQLVSLIAEGALVKFPNLKVALAESGFTWWPSFAWRLTKEWKGLRRDIPWVKESPMVTLRERIRLAIAPIDCDRRTELANRMEWIGTDDLLMFATDYPHWHDDDIAPLLELLDAGPAEKLMAGNARTLYGL